MNDQQRNGAGPSSPDADEEGLDQSPDEDEEIDLLAALREETDADAPADLTLGGYMSEHDRPAAFEGSDGQPYTVDVEVEATDSSARGRQYAAFLVFVRWAGTGAGILDHVESRNIAFGDTEEEAREAALALTLYEVRAELDAAIDRRERDEET